MEIKRWKYKDKDFTEDDISDNYGFVYVITNLQNGKNCKHLYSLQIQSYNISYREIMDIKTDFQTNIHAKIQTDWRKKGHSDGEND